MWFCHQRRLVSKTDTWNSLALVFCLWFGNSACFNVDTRNSPQIFSGSPNSYFGVSVGLLSNNKGKWLLVGAPKGNSSHIPVAQTGLLLKCSLNGSRNCQEVKVDDEGNRYYENYWHNRKEKQHLGISLDCQPTADGGRVVVCAHLWSDQRYTGHYLVNGMCFELDNNLTFPPVSNLKPLTQSSRQILKGGVYYFAHGQAGMSAHYTNTGGYLLLGAPGVRDWSGTVIEFPTNRRNFVVIKMKDEVKEFSQAGYAVSSGVFFPHGRMARVVGAPKENDRGKVIIYEPEPFVNVRGTDYYKEAKAQIITEKFGKQMGSYFGSSVCAADVNHDGLDDLFVGAPLYTDVHGDEGRVYFYLNEGMGLLTLQEPLLTGSKSPFARFGTTISKVGDINMDSYEDVVISAPYEEGGVGAIYVYYGSAAGVRITELQRIPGSSLDPGLRGFGYAISRGMDLDDNGYPDFAVGAFISDNSVVLYSRPVVTMDASLTVTPTLIDIQSHQDDCVLGGKHYICQNLTLCLTYDGHRLPRSLSFVYNITVDKDSMLDQARQRAMFVLRADSVEFLKEISAHRMIVRKRLSTCQEYLLTIEDNPRDLLRPIVYSIDVDFIQTSDNGPVMSRFTQTHFKKQTEYIKDCGSNKICESDLHVSAEVRFPNNRRSILLGADNHVPLRIKVENRGEDAFETVLTIQYSRDLQFVHVETKKAESAMCDRAILNETDVRETVTCDIGNPLKAGTSVVLLLTLTSARLQLTKLFEAIEIDVSAASQSVEQVPEDNEASLRTPITLDCKLVTRKKSNPEQLYYSKNVVNETEPIKPQQLTHLLDITNRGPSLMPPLRLELFFPTRTANGEPLAELTSIEITNDNLKDASWSCQTNLDSLNSSARVTEIGATEIINDGKSGTTVLDCATALCSRSLCVINQMGPKESLLLTLFASLNLTTLRNSQDMEDSTRLTSSVIMRSNWESYDTHNLTSLPSLVQVSTLIYRKEREPKKMAGWILAVSIGVGIGLLGTLVVIFWKVGFFRRKEREDLQRLLQEEADNLIEQHDDYEVPSPSYLNSPTSPTPLLDPRFGDEFGF